MTHDPSPDQQPADDRHDPEDAWIVLVHDGIVQQSFAPEQSHEAYRALAESPLPIQAYAVRRTRAPAPVPGSRVRPAEWGWPPVVAAFSDAHG